VEQDKITVVNATEDFLRDSLAKSTLRVGELEEHISRVTQRSYGEAAERNRMRTEMQEWTLEAIDCGTLNESEGQEIADICGFELTKEFELDVTVMYSITVNARNEEDAHSAVHDIDFDTVSYDEPVVYLSSSVDRIDS
jgi:hypothetical protein